MVLEISSSCNNSILFTFLAIVKTLLNILHIIVPLLLILSLTISLTKLVQDPDEKKTPKNILNSVLSAVIIFFLPTMINVVINLVADDSNFSNCWENASIRSNLSHNYQEIDGNKKQKINNNVYEPGNKQNNNNNNNNNGNSSGNNSSSTVNGVTLPFDLEHAIKVGESIHTSKNGNLKWQGKIIHHIGGTIGAYEEAINIFNGTDYHIYEIYDILVKAHPNLVYKHIEPYKCEDINSKFGFTVSRASANINEVDKALSQGKLVQLMVGTNKWRNSKGKLLSWPGSHTGLIFYFDGTYYHMKAAGKINQKNAIYTRQQLIDWIGHTKNRLVIYTKNKQ